METNSVNACHLAIDDNIFILNYNKAVVVREGIAYTNTTSRLRRLVRYKSSGDVYDGIVGTSADDLVKQSHDKSESVIENKGYRLHWLCSIHCQDMFIPCRVSGLHFPDSMMGQMLELQYLIECKPDDFYIDSFTKVLEYSITQIVMKKVQFHEFTLIPGYSIQLNWLMPRNRKLILSKIGGILCLQKTLRIASFEYQRLHTFEAIKLLICLAQGAGTTLKELFLWYFFKAYTCPLISHYSTNKDVKNTYDEERPTTVARNRKIQIEVSSFDELKKRFHRTSELDLLAEVERRVIQPIKGHSRKIKPAKLRSVALCECCEVDSGLDIICNLCQRNAKGDLTYSAMDKLELEREIHDLLYFPLDDKKIYFLDDAEKCLQHCHNYIAGANKRNLKEQNIRMIYRISLSAFTCLTRLSINYSYLADGSGETLLCIGAIRKGELTDLEILCTKNDIPLISKQSHTELTRRNSIPNTAWRKAKCLCPHLRLHLAMYGISKYNSASPFMTKNMPITSLHISTGNNIAKPVNSLKPGEKLELWNFDQVLKSIGMFHDSLVYLTLEMWLLPYRTDNALVKMLMKLNNLERFLYRGPIQSLDTIDRICNFYLENKDIIELKIWKIQEPLFRPEKDLNAIKSKEELYKPRFKSRDVDFALGSFPF